jgi:peptide deformylase
MAIQKVIIVPDPILRQKSQPIEKIDKKTLGIIRDLLDTLKIQKNPRGVGLSAPQIGISKRVFVLEIEKKLVALINPEIVKMSKETSADMVPEEKKFLEGCLSVPNFWGFVNRPYQIKVSFMDKTGNKITKDFLGKEACYFLHEYDHLDGILFVDRILEQKGKIYQIEKDKEGKEELVEVELIK